MTQILRIVFLMEILVLLLVQFLYSVIGFPGNYDKDFSIINSPDHVSSAAHGRIRELKLDEEAGGGFGTSDSFLFGRIDMQIKLVHGYSAGTVVAFYMRSDQPTLNEIDLEFLGNVTGQPYILQTNIYADGHDDKEQRIILWFNPTKHFHTYSILWNLYQIVFLVDNVPIRVFRNHEDQGVAFLGRYPMNIRATIWNGDGWATRGGQDKVDWSKGPFIASFRDYKIDACTWRGDAMSCIDGWWNNAIFSTLTPWQIRHFSWVRKYRLVYDYCLDNQRFQNNLPKECSLPFY